MEAKDVVIASLERSREEIMRVLDGLSQSELTWRPGSGCNSIGIILFHSVRSEDNYVQDRIQHKPTVWDSEKWYQKINMGQADRGSGFNTPEEVNAFNVPEFKAFMPYAMAVRERTIQYLNSLKPADLDRIINVPRRGDISIGKYLGYMVVHVAEHAGEISYIRGLQRGLSK